MPPSRALLDLISSRTSPSCLLAAARESLASIENDIALQMSTGSEADNVDEGGLRALESSNGSTQTRIKRSSEEGGGPGSSTPRNATGTEKENAPWLNKKDIERELKTPAEKMDVMTEETERKVSFWKDAENKYTIPQLEMQREVFVKDIKWLEETMQSDPERTASRKYNTSESPHSNDIGTPTPPSGRRGRRTQRSHVLGTRERLRSRAGSKGVRGVGVSP